jgi:ribosomal protein S18 acetylase RimI-like enzyme
LAVAGPHQGRGLGKLLLRDAILRFLQAADIIGARALLVQAKNARVAAFYAGFGFEPLPLNPLHMALLQKDARLTAQSFLTSTHVPGTPPASDRPSSSTGGGSTA